MMRQENAVPIFTYENEERDKRQQSAKRNPYLVDYAKQYGQQGDREEDAAFVTPINWQRQQSKVRRSCPAEEGGYARTSLHTVSGTSDCLDRRRDEGVRQSRLKRQMEPIDLTRSNGCTKFDVPVHSGRRPGNASGRPAASTRRPGSVSSHAAAPRRAENASERAVAISRRPGNASGRAGVAPRRAENASERAVAISRRPGNASGRAGVAPRRAENASGRAAAARRPGNASGRAVAMSRRPGNASGRSAAASVNRKKRAYMQRLAIGLWALGIIVLATFIMFKDSRVSAAQNNQEDARPAANTDEGKQDTSGILVQGLPAEEFAKHPDWTENFLTPNEYSRPGEALEKVTNIFVHYTANPGTSAAQNRSYFEQQKDTHERSVSAHFIIGYEGEIIQCVPLDEIAYAVATRNSDSISIECCYLASDGSFTQKTYDSLIALLAWLIDVYDLDSNDILRHYDCGGKKCPIYYTEHPGEWEQLKKDVDNL